MLGYTETSNGSEAAVIWSHYAPFWNSTARKPVYEYVQVLRPDQHVNQLPGMGLLTNKASLAGHSAKFNFLPKTFQIPAEYDEWQKCVPLPLLAIAVGA